MKTFLRALAVVSAVLVFLVVLRHRVSGQNGFSISLSSNFCNYTSPHDPCVLTYHNDASRDGVSSEETVLSPSTIFGNLAATVVSPAPDGLIYAQPLYIHQLAGSNGNVGSCTGATNTVFVATENNSVYAYNAGSGANCWATSLNTSTDGATAIPFGALPLSPTSGKPVTNLAPQTGITSTPVIDASVSPPIMYVVSQHQLGTTGSYTYDQRLHALDTTTGNEIISYADFVTNLPSSFVPIMQNQRAGLALYTDSNHIAHVYAFSGSYGDSNRLNNGSRSLYNGWAAEYQLNYTNWSNGFSFVGSFATETPASPNNPPDGGVWMGGAAPAIDASGNVYPAVGNGQWAAPGQNSWGYGNSVIKLQYVSQSNPLAAVDYYTPNDVSELDTGIGQVCFGAPLCPPGSTGSVNLDSDMGTGGSCY